MHMTSLLCGVVDGIRASLGLGDPSEMLGDTVSGSRD
jgi:hypothetical protein